MTGRNVVDTVAICNVALRHLAQTAGIVDLDNDASEAAEACRTFLPFVLDECLSDFPWPFQTKYASPALVLGPTPMAIDGQYIYAYRYPVDCLLIRRIVNPTDPVRTQFNTIDYRVGADDEGLLIYTNAEPVTATATTAAQPQIEYTMALDSTAFWPSSFAMACSFLLASYIAPSLTGGDKFGLGKRAAAMYEWKRQSAQNQAINEGQPTLPPEASWIEARGGEGGGNSNWPFGITTWTAWPSSLP